MIPPSRNARTTASIREENITPQNVKMVLAARQLVEERQNSDFQRLY